MSEFNETNTKKGNGLLIAGLMILLLAIGFMAFKLSRMNSQLNDCMNENTTLNATMQGMNEMLGNGYVDEMSNDLKTDFQNMLKTYDALIAKDKSKADSLNIQKQKIQSLITELEDAKRNGRLSASKLFNLRKENETLRNIMKGYVYQIDSLNTLNLKLSSDLSQTSTQLQQTSEERDQFKQEAEKQSEQVRKGSKLQAYGFNSVGLRMKMNNTTEVTNKAKNVVQVRSSFTISENPITSAGKKSVYMQVIDPDGKTLQSRTSNVVTTEAGSIAYSDKKDIDYQNQAIDMSIYYDLKGEEAIKGNYKVKIYCDGNLIGSDSFTLK